MVGRPKVRYIPAPAAMPAPCHHPPPRPLMRLCLTLGLLAASALAANAQTRQAGRRPDPRCAPDNGGITLPAGFYAAVFADSVAGARHLVVAPNGDVFVSTYGARGSAP